ncbi:hypothetical protein ACIGZJ_25710 [Kitasatospora sp. NPDC052868]
MDAVVECVSEREEEIDPVVEATECAINRWGNGPFRFGSVVA